MSASEPGGGNAAATPGAEGLLDAVKFGPDGLVTAVAVDDRDGEVVMLAHMNRESLGLTLRTGLMTYWSRSRQKFWVKGEESGNTQEIVSVAIDCDQDAVVLRVRQKGAACHNGFESCFYRQIVAGDAGGLQLKTTDERVMDPGQLYKK